MGIIRDVTKNKLAEQELKKNEAFLQESQQVARIGSYEWDLANKGWKGTRTLDEIFGIDDSYSRTYKGWGAIIHPDDRQAVGRQFKQSIAEKRNFNAEYRIQPLNGGPERWVRGIGHLYFNTEGVPIRQIGTVQDITDYKRTEEERES